MNTRREISFINHIYISTNQSKKKNILLFHGWGSSVKNYEKFAESLATLGFQVVVPELVFHDSRNKLENHFAEKITQEYFWQTVFTSIDEGNSLIEELGVRAEDIILLGISMGGFIANGLYANGRPFAGLININGSGSYLLSEEIFRKNGNRSALSFEEKEVFHSYNPIGKTRGSSPVLLMHGEQDKTVSIKGQEDYYKYLNKECVRTNAVFLKYKDIDHTTSEEMTADLISWLKVSFE